MTDTIQELIKRTTSYQYRDGLVEIAVGVLWAIVALAQLAMGLAVRNGVGGWVVGIALGMVALIMAGALLSQRVVAGLKDRLTYPRTGYVEVEQRNPRAQTFVIVMAVAVVVLARFGTQIGIPGLTRVSTTLSLLFGAILIFFGLRARTQRFFVAAVLTVGAGVMAIFFGLDEYAANALVIGVSGGSLLLTGSYALLRYLRDNPAAEGTAQ